MIDKLEFINNIFGDFKPRYRTIQSIKLYSEDRDGKYYGVYLALSPLKTLMLSLVNKVDRCYKEKVIISFPAYIKNDLVYLCENEDYEDKEEYKLLKEFEEDLYINPVILNIIKMGLFEYIPKDALIQGGEPSITEESFRKSLNIPNSVELTKENILDACITKDYIMNFSEKNNHMYKRKDMSILSVYNLCAFGTGMPNCNIRHSAVHPFIFKDDDKGNKVIYGEFFITNNNRFFRIKNEAPHVMIQYKDNCVNTDNALMITYNSMPSLEDKKTMVTVNYVIKSVEDYEKE